MRKALITKTLNKKQESIAHDYGLTAISHAFSKITLEFDTVEVPKADVWIITSPNAARYLSAHFDDMARETYPDFIVCLDDYTAENVKQLGLSIKTPEYGTIDNVIQLVKDLDVDSAIFFSGNYRSKNIPEALQDNMEFIEFQVYHTDLIEDQIDMDEIDAIAFFSPSDVKGFASKNKITNQVVIAVNTLTRKAVQKQLDVRAGVPASHSVEDVLFALKEEL